jgi:micrococcal nuclease
MGTQYRRGTSLLLLVMVIAAVALFAVFVAPHLKSSFVAETVGGPPSSGATSGALSPALPPVTPPVATEHGVVIHIVDGDTLDVKLGGVRTRIRLLNVDTPETVKPDTPVECMGPQASARLAQLAPLGSTVGLAFDVERTDQYGRTLATVITPSGQNASEVLASEGLGVAVKYGQNTAGYAAIVVAQKHAQATKLGLYSGACG